VPLVFLLGSLTTFTILAACENVCECAGAGEGDFLPVWSDSQIICIYIYTYIYTQLFPSCQLRFSKTLDFSEVLPVLLLLLVLQISVTSTPRCQILSDRQDRRSKYIRIYPLAI